MKKVLIIFGFVVTLLGCSLTSSYASDLEKHKTISEIGILSNAEKYDEALQKCEAALVKYPDDPKNVRLLWLNIQMIRNYIIGVQQ